MKIDLEEKRGAVFGLPGSGKSNFLCWLAETWGSRCLVFDPEHEFPLNSTFDVYRPTSRNKPYELRVAELEKLLKVVVKLKKHKLIEIDEAGDYLPSKPTPLTDYMAAFNRRCRHPEFNRMIPIYACQRPTQLNQDITAMCHFLFIFNLAGKADIDYLDDMARGLGEAAFNLPEYHFLVVNQRRKFTSHSPVPLMELGHKIKKGG